MSYIDSYKQHFTWLIIAAVTGACIPPGGPDISEMMDGSSLAILSRSSYIIMQVRGQRTEE